MILIKLFLLLSGTALALEVAHAQGEIFLELGEKKTIPITINTESTCNVDLMIGLKREQRTIEPGDSQFVIEFDATELGPTEIKWEGKFRPRGLKSLSACESKGSLRVVVQVNSNQRKAEWEKLFSGLRPDQVECLRIGLKHKGVVYETIDPLAKIDSTSAPAARHVFSKCNSFLSARTPWGLNAQDDFPCTLRNGAETRCRGVYAERTPDGKLKGLSKDDAIRLHMDGGMWTVIQTENQQGKSAREDKAKLEQERRDAEAAARKESEDRARLARVEAEERARLAKVEADERERKWKTSPEYKRQQAEQERQRQAEAKEAEAKEKRDRELAALKEKEDKRKIESLRSTAKNEASAVDGDGDLKVLLRRDDVIFYALSDRACAKVSGLTQGIQEHIAARLEVSSRSIDYLRMNNCIVVVDTPSGPMGCGLGSVVRRSNGTFLASELFPISDGTSFLRIGNCSRSFL